ncbi:hypothetical protein J4573_47085 [Actinomadura barringtoniae]|uniref:Uncharacterized protein n=1 Tax=Actinomadura barringtoniae TaxID=1427535 RepID=A0A939PLC3_9ACTN|nr:hypothetical protein [Actinomadura barringtoniae]MBO2454725.1 hypothetical protein [Actinomadura barringtoniae]
MLDEGLFEHVGEVVRGSAPRDLGELRVMVRRNGVKAWFGDAAPHREHYEAQVIGADILSQARTHALEIGFHAEHSKAADNDAALQPLIAGEPAWRAELGPSAEAGAFIGPANWRRVSEIWLDPDLDDADIAFEIGVRLVEYMTALEPHRRGSSSTP